MQNMEYGLEGLNQNDTSSFKESEEYENHWQKYFEEGKEKIKKRRERKLKQVMRKKELEGKKNFEKMNEFELLIQVKLDNFN